MLDALEFWDREIATPTHVSWMADDDVRRYINSSISGSGDRYPLDWFEAAFPRRFGRTLSIGCGGGAFERDLIRREIATSIDAFDGSIVSVETARREAAREGYAGRIRYYVADFNSLSLPASVYDLVVVHQALHHVEELESLYAAIVAALKPDGLLYFDEYVGPSRVDWTEEMLAPQRAVYATLPRQARLQETLLLPIQPDDPSEGVRSSEILPLLAVGFDIVEQRGYGGNILSVLFPAIDWSKAPSGLPRELIERERDLLRSGAAPFHTVVVAKPLWGGARDAAIGRYARLARVNRGARSRAHIRRAVVAFRRRVVAAVKRRMRAAWTRVNSST